jgi:hypothetical protein
MTKGTDDLTRETNALAEGPAGKNGHPTLSGSVISTYRSIGFMVE